MTLIHAVPGAYQFGSWNNIVLARWESPAEAIGVAHLQAIGKAFQMDHPGSRQSGIHIVLEGVGLPTADGRAALMQLARSQAGHVAAVAVVICGSGFVAGAVRSFLVGLRLAVPRSFDLRVHSKTSEVTTWLPAAHRVHTGEEIDAVKLGRVLAAFAGGATRT